MARGAGISLRAALMAASSPHHDHHTAAPQLHPLAGSGNMASSSPVHGGGQSQHDANALAACYHHVDPSPSTSSTSGSTAAAALRPVPCFSDQLSWVDQYGPGLDGPVGAFDPAALGSLGLDGLDLGPADCDAAYSADTTLLDYLNSTCTGSAMMNLAGSGNFHGSCDDAMGDGGWTTWRTTTDELCQAAARKLGDHQWGGGI
ncbi:hypothetical protein EJB05_31785 [Eragrostis curvula]|uniref:Uncharacterized protein n=1 Tax=Eragrostis curvula TaxID=38414 RepID=A0A5J9UEG5_9POAL|nr:hypothetical protein EJB05_31785 [Eragrostis curvula]